MSNSSARPILRTTDLERTYDAAGQLVALADRCFGGEPRSCVEAATRPHHLRRSGWLLPPVCRGQWPGLVGRRR